MSCCPADGAHLPMSVAQRRTAAQPPGAAVVQRAPRCRPSAPDPRASADALRRPRAACAGGARARRGAGERRHGSSGRHHCATPTQSAHQRERLNKTPGFGQQSPSPARARYYQNQRFGQSRPRAQAEHQRAGRARRPPRASAPRGARRLTGQQQAPEPPGGSEAGRSATAQRAGARARRA